MEVHPATQTENLVCASHLSMRKHDNLTSIFGPHKGLPNNQHIKQSVLYLLRHPLRLQVRDNEKMSLSLPLQRCECNPTAIAVAVWRKPTPSSIGVKVGYLLATLPSIAEIMKSLGPINWLNSSNPPSPSCLQGGFGNFDLKTARSIWTAFTLSI